MPETCCVVPLCSNKGRHIMPKDRQRRDSWIHAIRRGKSQCEKWSPPSKYSYICEKHFTSEDYNSLTYAGTEREKRSLKKSAIPSVFAWTCPDTIQRSNERCKRYNERTSRKRKLFEDLSNISSSPVEPEYVATKKVAYDFLSDDLNVGACEEVIPMETVESELCSDSDNTYNRLRTIDAEVQTPRAPAFSVYNFENDPAGIHFYTGLENYRKFFFVLYSLGPAAFCLNYVYHGVENISVPDQFFLVLMKIRRHTTNFELSRMFGIAESVIANIFITWIIFMDKQWKTLNIWPSRDLVKHFAPQGFRRSYPNTRVIIDGTECPIKRPKNPTAQQATFSTYKNRNTVKVLVGATPGGLVSYISNAYGGSTSDRQIVERSSLDKMCEQNDSIMADKGFNVQDIFAPHDVHINIPTFFKKKNRMSNETVLRDRKISSKRVHIERIIGLAKTYKILTEPMTATETKFSSQIIFVCFMLCNFRKRIVSSSA